MDIDDEYAGAPPRLVAAEVDVGEEAAAALSLEERFAVITQELMRDEVDVSEALLAWKDASTSHVGQLRDRASGLLHRAAHYLAARQLADDLEAQGATWELLLHLYAMGEAPAGLGGPAIDEAGGRRTARQALRGAVNGDLELSRVAQVVAWLESLAAQRLAAAPPLGFSAAEGVWRETLLLSRGGGGGGGGGGGVELDPDAPTRGVVALRGEDQRNEERLASQLWQLLRAGKLQQAQELCRRCGQNWRAAALAGGGPWGPLPVGAAAADADECMEEEWQAEDLAAEVEGGRGAGRALWRWACAAVADAAASATPGNRWEAAVFGALAGHVARVLPVCAGWEDEAWAYCRAWLDHGADERAAAEEEEARAAFRGDDGAPHGAADAHAIPSDVLASLLEDAAASGYTQAANPQLLQEGLTVAASEGGAAVAKLQRLRRDGSRALVPASFDDLRALLAASAAAGARGGGGGAAGGQQRALQLHLMGERWHELVLELAGAALVAHQQQQQQEASQRAAGAAAGGALLRRAGDPGFALLRFAAHLALALRALGLVRDPSLIDLQARAYGLQGIDEDEEQEAARLQEVLGKVIHQYADALASEPAGWPLVPPYLCHLREPVRAALLARLVRAAAGARAGDAACLALHSQLAATLEAWRLRQERLDAEIAAGRVVGDAECGPTSLLSGDVRPGELRSLLATLMAAARAGPADGPAARARLLRWLFYPFVAAQRAAAAAAAAAAAGFDGDEGGGGGDAAAALQWDGSWGDALHHAVGLAAELALSPAPAALSLAALFEEVVPDGFIEAAAEQLASVEAEPLQLALVERQLAALAFWRDYASLDAAYRSWKANVGAALLGGAGGAAAADFGHSAEAAVARSEALAERLLGLAEADGLGGLVAPGDDAAGAGEDPTCARLLVVAAGAGDEDEYRSAVDARQLAAALEPVLASLAASQDVDASVALPGDDEDVAGGAGGAASLDELLLRREEAAEQLRAGAVVVRLASSQPPLAPGAPEHERARVQVKARRAWEAMAAKAAWLIGGSRRCAAGGGDLGFDAPEARPPPRLVVVSLGASFSTVAQVARHRTAAKLLIRAAKVLLALARVGHYSAPLSARLAELAAGAAAPPGGACLTDLLAPCDARRLLQLMAAALEEAPPGPGAVLI
ncbi:MAG: 107-domain-containing protein [Monoraphidium minutum]|nr:MAG: 107-domain-containing protein [Monoraphidium minutum]